MRCYICDYSDNGAQSSYYLSLSHKGQGKNHRVKFVDGKFICENCLRSTWSTVAQTKRISEPSNPDNYRHDPKRILSEFKEDLPLLYSLLDADGVLFDPDVSHKSHHKMLDNV